MCSEVPESRQHFELTDEYSCSDTKEELILELKECDLGPPNYTVEPGYNDIGFYDPSPITSDILRYQLIPQC
jgi:hypothetical protein